MMMKQDGLFAMSALGMVFDCLVPVHGMTWYQANGGLAPEPFWGEPGGLEGRR